MAEENDNKKPAGGLLEKLASLSAMRKSLLQLHNDNPHLSEELAKKTDDYKKKLTEAAKKGDLKQLDTLYKEIDSELKNAKWKPLLALEKTNNDVSKMISTMMGKKSKTGKKIYKTGLSLLALNDVMTLMDSTNTNLLSEKKIEQYEKEKPDVIQTQKIAQKFCSLTTLCDSNQKKAKYTECNEVIKEKERREKERQSYSKACDGGHGVQFKLPDASSPNNNDKKDEPVTTRPKL